MFQTPGIMISSLAIFFNIFSAFQLPNLSGSLRAVLFQFSIVYTMDNVLHEQWTTEVIWTQALD